MISHKTKLIVYLDRQKIIFAGAHLAAPLTLELPVNIVLDLDIIDPESFNQLLENFLEISKISPSDVILVISPEVYYEKDVTLSTDPQQRQSQIDLFLETVPFKNLLSKYYQLTSTPKLITLNKNYYEPLIKLFEKNGYNVICLLPAFILNHFHLSLDNFLPPEINNIFKKYNLIEPQSLINLQEINKIVNTTVHHPKEDNTRTYILLGVFCFLFVVLLGYIFIAPRLYKPPIVTLPPPAPTAAVTPTPLVAETTPIIVENFLTPDLIRIKVVNSSGVQNQAANIKIALTAIGYKKITALSSTQLTAAKNQIKFSSKVSPSDRQKIFDTVSNIAGASLETENIDISDFDVLINTAFKPVDQASP